MKLLKVLPGLVAALLLGRQTAQATVAIFTGTEVQVDHHATDGMGHNSNGTVRLTGQIYFLYDLETGRSIEIRVRGTNYKVRDERNFVYIRTSREPWTTDKYTIDTFLGDAARVNHAEDATVKMASWEGSKLLSMLSSPEKDPATGLPSIFPKALTSRQDIAAVDTSGDRTEAHIRRTDTVVIAAGFTKASNVATDNFEAALQRLKDALNARGLTEVPSLSPSLDQ
jgi:hypothetical protein